MNKDDKLMKIMKDIIVQAKTINRSDLMKQARISINQYNKIKSHFEERYTSIEYDKSERIWRRL